MKGRMIVVGTEGLLSSVEITSPPTAEEIHALVGGPIELIPRFDRFGNGPCVAFCHEEGKLEGFLWNTIAQALWEQAVGSRIANDYLVGPVVIITGDDDLLRSL